MSKSSDWLGSATNGHRLMRKLKIAELHLSRPSPSLEQVCHWAERRHKVDRMFVTLYTDRVKGKWKPSRLQAEKSVMELFSPFILRVFLATSWPPSDYLRHPHIVCVMRYSPEVRDILLKREPNFKNWLNEYGLPEDICLFNSRATLPACASSTHDLAAWLFDAKGINGDFFDTWEETPAQTRHFLSVHDGYAFCRVWSSQRHIAVPTLGKFVKAKRRILTCWKRHARLRTPQSNPP
jgi:hypothetical protein